MTNLTIFDLDNTLLGGDSDHAWGEFLAAQGIVDRDAHMQANNRFYEQYKNQTLDIIEYQSFVLKPLMGMSRADRDALHREFETITFYSDSINDRPLLEFSDKPVVVDPDDKLKKHALAVGWPIISLRD